MKATSVLLFSFALATFLSAQPAPEKSDDKSIKRRPVVITWDFKIPARDGVKLSGTVYRPADQKEPLPVILTLTPYIAAHAAKQGNYFAQNGYVFVAVDDRGRGNSEGVFVPGEVEGKDGYDAVEFLARQPWCNGDVATWGGSWLGFTQWSIAKEFPPHLKAIAPTAAVYPGVDYPNPGGMFIAYMLQWLTYVDGHSGNDGLFNESSFWENLYWNHYLSGRPFEQLDVTSGITNTVFRKWLSHPYPDSFWDAMTPSEEQFRRITIPVLTITGHYDGDQRGALTYYRRHMRLASPEAAARHDLVIGPYDHGGTRRPKDELGGFKVGAGAVLDMEKLHKEWYDYVLKGKPRPEFLKDRIAYYLVGEGSWHYVSSWDAFLADPLSLYLRADNAEGHELFQSASLSKDPPAANGALGLVLDPTKPLDRDAYEEKDNGPNYMVGQREAYSVGENSIFFHSAPFNEETELTGIPDLRVWISSNVPDADLHATLSEVRPDGTAVFMSSCWLRLRYRDDPRKPQLLPIDTPVEVDLRDFSFFSHKISRNSRIRLRIELATGPGIERNTHTGGVVASEGIDKARAARLLVMTDPEHASVLRLPRAVSKTTPLNAKHFGRP
jgi:putative CocE/NonD family hydrolase